MEAGQEWFQRNFIDTGKINNVQVMTSGQGGLVFITYKDGTSQTTGAGSDQRASDIVGAYLAATGQAGASKPTDPISASAANLVQSTATTSAIASTAKTSVANVATKTGLPSWLVWIGFLFIGFLLLRFLWRWIKRRKLRRRR